MKMLPLFALAAAAFLAVGCEPADTTLDDDTVDPVVVENRGVDLDRQTPPPMPDTTRNTTGDTDPDNTGVNERDASGDTVTPEDQPNRSEDVELLATLRSRVMEIENLSINGQNVKIISQGDKVVLRGPVQTEAERDAIVAVAKDVVGAENVINELEVNDDQ
jgi:hypothetical protein